MTGWVETSGPGFGLHFGYPDEAAYAATLAALVEKRVASRLAARDHTLWGEDAQKEAAKRLDWVSLPHASRSLVPEIVALRTQLIAAGLNRVVLCGMGGSSLAPEVICGSADVPLEILDTANPDTVRDETTRHLAETVVVVSSKSGGTVETDSQKRAFEEAFRDAGIDPTERIIVVTDPGSPLDESATAEGYRVFRADPEVGGRYSALTAFGLVPSGLAGVDIGQLLDQAESLLDVLGTDGPANPGLQLGALLGLAATRRVDKLVLANAGATFAGLGDWIEQLIAESTGKHGHGLLPVVVGDTDAPNFSPSTPDSILASYGPDFPFIEHPPASGYGVAIDAHLGAQMQIWEVATAVAGRIIGINPFDQPDVESAKKASREMLDGAEVAPAARFADGEVEVYAGDWLPESVSTAKAAVEALLATLAPESGYLAVQAYLDRHRDAELFDVRRALAQRTGRPVTFGWGSRFLHSTGQYHKGGPPTGVFLQVSTDPEADMAVPGREFTFGEFFLSQSVGDAQVLSAKGRPVLRLHLRDLKAGIEQVKELLG